MTFSGGCAGTLATGSCTLARIHIPTNTNDARRIRALFVLRFLIGIPLFSEYGHEFHESPRPALETESFPMFYLPTGLVFKQTALGLSV